MTKVLSIALESGWAQEKYKGIIEIYPRKCMNTYLLNKLFVELNKTHDIVKLTDNWIRAFEKE